MTPDINSTIDIRMAAAIWQEGYRQAVDRGMQPPAAGRAAAALLCESQHLYTLHAVRDAFEQTGEHPAAVGYMKSVLEFKPSLDTTTTLEQWVAQRLGGYLDI
jgi:hypothetical protein